MSLLVANKVTRVFKSKETEQGFVGAVKGLFGQSKKKIMTAVEDFSFTIEKGEIVGLIGPNGAGKSTIVKMATGIILPTGGEMKVFDGDPFVNRIKNARRYGVVFGQRSNLWWNLSAMETFNAFMHIYDLEKVGAKKQIEYLVDVLQISDIVLKPVRQLSLGQRMRCEMASALIHKPELIFLDEPTIGLDVVSKNHVRNYIQRINKEQGVSVLLTSHDMIDVERLSHRILVIDKGHLAYNGPMDPLRDRFAPERYIEIDFAKDPGVISIPGVEVVSKDAEKLVVKFDSRKLNCMDILATFKGKCEISDFSVKELPIDEVIARIYQQGFGDNKDV